MAERLPRGALKAAELALVKAATDFGHGDLIAGPSEKLARAVLDAVLPVIERDACRRMARDILALNEEDENLTRQGYRYHGPYGDMQTSLRRLARGEALPDAKELRGGNA